MLACPPDVATGRALQHQHQGRESPRKLGLKQKKVNKKTAGTNENITTLYVNTRITLVLIVILKRPYIRGRIVTRNRTASTDNSGSCVQQLRMRTTTTLACRHPAGGAALCRVVPVLGSPVAVASRRGRTSKRTRQAASGRFSCGNGSSKFMKHQTSRTRTRAHSNTS